jgi:glycosyl transferase family 25
VKTFVVNLPEALQRREAIERQLRSLGLDYEMVDAVRGRSLTTDERSRHYNDQKFHRLVGRSIGAGELGCSLSHLEVYRRITSRGIAHALVLEDDAWLSPNVPALLEAIEGNCSPEARDLLLLSWANPIASKGYRRLWSGYVLARALGGIGSHGYVISRAAAAELQKRLYPVCHTADCWAWLNRHGYVNLLAVTPPPISLDLAYGSDVADEVLTDLGDGGSERGRTAVQKIGRVWWRLFDEIRAFKDRADLH